MGLVDLQDRPYEELTAAFTRVHAQIAALHREGPQPQGLVEHDGAWSIPPHSGALDGRLEDWSLARHWAAATATLEPDLPFGDFYLGWQPEGIVLALAYYDFALGADVSVDLRSRKRLQLTLGAPGAASTSVVVLGFDERTQGNSAALAAAGSPQVRGAQRIRNLLTTAEVLIPASLFGQTRLQAGQLLRLEARFLLEGDARELRWPSPAPGLLRLAPQAPGLSGGERAPVAPE
jgi:hypothetical protein